MRCSEELGWSVAELIDEGVDAERLVRADIAQPLLFAIQVGIVTVLRDLGIEAAGHIGHSVGEIGAAWASGALSLSEAARVVVARSRNQERTRGSGRMAALALGAEAAEELIAEIGSPLEVGAKNARQSVTVSGAAEAIQRLAAEARRRGMACRPLDLDFAFHSAAMDPIRGTLLRDLDGLRSDEPRATLISTVTGERVGADELGADYWWQNIRKPVQFTDAVAALLDDGCRILVEIGPNPVLQSYLHDGLRAREAQGRVLATLSRRQDGGDPFPAIAAKCHVAGYDVTEAHWFDGPQDPRGLPLYAWQREPFWFERTTQSGELVTPAFEHPLLGYRQKSPVPFWLNHLDTELLPWVADHAIEGVPVLPAAAVLEMGLAAARARRPEAAVLEVADVELRRPLPFDKGRARELRTVLSTEDGDWELSSRPRLADEPLTLHAVGRIATASDVVPAAPVAPRAVPEREVAAATLYALANRLGLIYGPQFQTVSRIEVFAPDEAVAYLDASAISDSLDQYLIHPALLDGALQGLLALLAEAQPQLQGISFLPWRFGRVRAVAPFGRVPAAARLRVTRLGTRSASANILLLDGDGAVVSEMTDCWFRRVELSRRGSVDDRVLRIDLVPAPLAEAAPPAIFERIGEDLGRIAAIKADEHPQSGERALLLEALVAAVALRSVLSSIDTTEPFTIDGLIENGRLAPEAAPLFGFLMRLLERFDAAEESEREWRLITDHELPELAEVWRLLLAEAPDLVAELALLAAASEELPKLLGDGLRQGEVAPLPMVEHLLHASPVSSAGIDLVCETLDRIAARWPEGRPCAYSNWRQAAAPAGGSSIGWRNPA